MPTSTTNYGLSKPNINSADDEDLWGDETNANWDEVDGLLKVATDTVTAAQTLAYSVTINDRNTLQRADATLGAINFLLPPAATAGNGFRIGFKKTDASVNAVTLDPDGSELIDGQTTYTLAVQNNYVVIVSDGVSWNVVASSFNTPIASTTLAGIVRLATAAETNTGTDATIALTPAGLAAHTLTPRGILTFDGTVASPVAGIAIGIAVGATINKTSGGHYTITLATARAAANSPITVSGITPNAGSTGLLPSPTMTTTVFGVYSTNVGGGTIVYQDSPYMVVVLY